MGLGFHDILSPGQNPGILRPMVLLSLGRLELRQISLGRSQDFELRIINLWDWQSRLMSTPAGLKKNTNYPPFVLCRFCVADFCYRLTVNYFILSNEKILARCQRPEPKVCFSLCLKQTKMLGHCYQKKKPKKKTNST